MNDVFAVSNWRLNPWLGDPIKALLLSFHLRIRGLFAATRGVAATKKIGGTESGGKNGTPTSQVGRCSVGEKNRWVSVLEDQDGNRHGLPGW
jgi:hypothetical protein